MKILRTVFVAVLAAAVVAAPVRAQSRAVTSVSAAPIAAHMSVGVQRNQLAPAPLGVPQAPRVDTKQNRAMMIVGGAAMLTGAIVGSDAGTLISVGGAVVFLWGLYQYLQ